MGCSDNVLLYEFQEDFPRTPSPVYQHSRSSSRAANDEGDAATAALDLQLADLRDASAAVTAAGMGSRSSTPIPGVSNMHQSSGPAAPVPRMASPESPIPNTRSASPALAMMAGVSGILHIQLTYYTDKKCCKYLPSVWTLVQDYTATTECFSECAVRQTVGFIRHLPSVSLYLTCFDNRPHC